MVHLEGAPMSRRAALALAALALAPACTTSRLVGEPPFGVMQQRVPMTPRDKVDLLFMIDNSPSMSPKQAALRARFPGLATRIAASQGLRASLHIGVVTSDLGAGPYTLNQGQCHPGGDGARLRTEPVAGASGVDSRCATFGLGDGEPFIDYDVTTGNSNIVGADLTTALGCMAAVGDAGCGFESPLEAVYQVLTDPARNPRFLRHDAVLVVVLLTDEDDCSAPPDSDLFDPSVAGVAQYGTLHSYRCSQFGIQCDGAPLDGKAHSSANCEPIPGGGKLFDVARYQSLFATIKAERRDVLLVSLAGPEAPVTVEVTSPCADQVNTPSCPVLAHSCVNQTNPTFFADPAVRIHAVVSATVNPIEASICDADYTAPVDALAQQMIARMQQGCLPGAVLDLRDPACTVTFGDVTLTPCGDGHLPCWVLTEDPSCPARPTPAGTPQRLRVAVQGLSGVVPEASCPLYIASP
jgi:hypothetical protein